MLCLNNCNFTGTKDNSTITKFEETLHPNLDTIEVTYIAWACECANWLPTSFLDDTTYESTAHAEDCIFIEADNDALIIPEAYHLGGRHNRIKLIGQFYKEKGVPKGYLLKAAQKPEKAKVFRYSEIEVIKPYTIWDFDKTLNDSTSNTLIIKKGMKAFYE